MTAYNVVRFKVKQGQEQKFIELHKSLQDLDGMKDGALIKTGDPRLLLRGQSGRTMKALSRQGPR